MVLVQRGRFTEWLKNLTGLRGPYSVDLDKGIAPVYDLSNPDVPELDQDQAWWFTSGQFLVASPGNFTSFACRTGSLKCRVTGVILSAQAAAQSYNIGLAADPGVGAVPAVLANDFLGSRGAVFSLAQNAFGPVTQFSRQNAVSLLFGANRALQINVAATASTFVFAFPLPFIIQPGWALICESDVVNQAMFCGFYGKSLADQT